MKMVTINGNHSTYRMPTATYIFEGEGGFIKAMPYGGQPYVINLTERESSEEVILSHEERERGHIEDTLSILEEYLEEERARDILKYLRNIPTPDRAAPDVLGEMEEPEKYLDEQREVEREMITSFMVGYGAARAYLAEVYPQRVAEALATYLNCGDKPIHRAACLLLEYFGPGPEAPQDNQEGWYEAALDALEYLGTRDLFNTEKSVPQETFVMEYQGVTCEVFRKKDQWQARRM